MPEQPETYEHLDLGPGRPGGCPWKTITFPGPIAPGLIVKAVPCAREHCALWYADLGRCTLSIIPATLRDIHSQLAQIAAAIDKLALGE